MSKVLIQTCNMGRQHCAEAYLISSSRHKNKGMESSLKTERERCMTKYVSNPHLLHYPRQNSHLHVPQGLIHKCHLFNYLTLQQIFKCVFWSQTKCLQAEKGVQLLWLYKVQFMNYILEYKTAAYIVIVKIHVHVNLSPQKCTSCIALLLFALSLSFIVCAKSLPP